MTLSANIKSAFERVAQEIRTSSGGSSLVFGTIVPSLLPLSNMSLVLLDGSILRADGVYGAGVTRIIALQTSNPDMFLSETDWQERKATYGEVERFVIGDDDGVATLRLPLLIDTWHKQKFYMVMATSGGDDVAVDLDAILPEINALNSRVTNVEDQCADLPDQVATVDSKVTTLETAIASMESRCTVEWFAVASPPEGYLLCDGAAVSRTTYANLFSRIGTTFGAGDGSTTFNVPNLIDRFAEGSSSVGIYKEAGLPNISGGIANTHVRNNVGTAGCGWGAVVTGENRNAYTGNYQETTGTASWDFYASRSNAIYGNSDTVQPPALTLLPCIRT